MDPLFIAGFAELLMTQIATGKVRKPESLDEWRDAIADGAARMK